MNPLRTFPGIKTRVACAARTVSITVSEDVKDHEAARDFIYEALNLYEPGFSVFIKGVPFCFLPDAYDHIIPTAAAPGTSRIPSCGACRLERLCGGPDAFPKEAAKLLSPVLARPNELVVELNRRCNLSCAVCSSRGLDDELSLDEVLTHLKRARALGIADIRFTGGEPFLHPRILTILRAAKKAGFYVLVNTNATLLDRALIKKAAPSIDNILVSMQGCDVKSETEATGKPGLFAKKTANMRLLRRSSIPVLRLGTVISGHLLKNFESYLRLAKDLKADTWELYRPMTPPGGPRDPSVTAAALRRLAARLEPGIGRSPRVVFANPLPFCLFRRNLAPLFLGARFDDGHTRLVLDPRGFYKPSYYIQEDLGTDLERAWNSAFLKKLDSPDSFAAKCRGCVFQLRCLGGSRFMARAERGASVKTDPLL